MAPSALERAKSQRGPVLANSFSRNVVWHVVCLTICFCFGAVRDVPVLRLCCCPPVDNSPEEEEDEEERVEEEEEERETIFVQQPSSAGKEEDKLLWPSPRRHWYSEEWLQASRSPSSQPPIPSSWDSNSSRSSLLLRSPEEESAAGGGKHVLAGRQGMAGAGLMARNTNRRNGNVGDGHLPELILSLQNLDLSLGRWDPLSISVALQARVFPAYVLLLESDFRPDR
ncbi:unnamed protein product [Notodromas monacha]|uniref:Uncharacterized protein n=1 Tax=Notodromas monacha TaxID=399045 RepID=A0A7R9BRK1_9CRUS|nr:unnamed protein product [Notodromas monacha]CAG0920045.1 unnamed protein product [Notodromas monacha]